MSQNFKDCSSPDAVVVALLDASQEFMNDAVNLDAAGQNGKPWEIIAHELDTAVSRIVRRIVASGYPVSDDFKLLAPSNVVRLR